MSKILVHFYPTDSHLQSNSSDHITHITFIERLPKEGDIWKFDKSKFDLLDSQEQKRFKQLFNSDSVNFKVLNYIDYRENPGDIDYSMFVAQQIIDGKSAFIDENDK